MPESTLYIDADDSVILWDERMEDIVRFNSGDLPKNWYDAIYYWLKNLWNHPDAILIYSFSVTERMEKDDTYKIIYFKLSNMEMKPSTHKDGGMWFIVKKCDGEEIKNWEQLKSIIK